MMDATGSELARGVLMMTQETEAEQTILSDRHCVHNSISQYVSGATSYNLQQLR
jgi:hypothetical protein